MPIEKWGFKLMEMPACFERAHRVVFAKAKILREQGAKGARALNEFYDETWEMGRYPKSAHSYSQVSKISTIL